MAKILTDKEMGQIVFDATHRSDVIECADAYEHFLEDLGELIASHFGGRQGRISRPDGDGLGWTSAAPKMPTTCVGTSRSTGRWSLG